MASSKAKSSSYAPLGQHDDDKDSIATLEEHSAASENDHSAPLLEAPDSLPSLTPSKSSHFPKLIFYFSLALVLLSTANVALLPATLSKYLAYPLTESQLGDLPLGDARLGLDRAAKAIPPPQTYDHSWPDKIARVSRKLKKAVWGDGTQVYITVEDSTVMRFTIPSKGVNACALFWRAPPEHSARAKDLETKGEISEIEVWNLIVSSVPSKSASIGKIDFDTLSYSTLPARGELLGTLDLTAEPNSTTVEFACPSDADSFTVELRCQRVACHVSFMQIAMAPRFGFELVRRRE
ncbi:uncharacterized protein F5Z01DRAFT_689968 [Emericellopsis atlantica]|uniref:Ubiquitin 3 binding protein But2 C-terminal domain-containing protein n=1 Tax=Emericellopsis atlantica TaxID=2614577 RepID=A0A9P7ZV02_9HYPO|nr:uncharacterized protein F5Z01DRAFT_689968 [Emericellopsis atlantica]KAG9258581.1 hypothetical protein F5Z01DRAFT_689968 [Emericellopsis atlantica]